MRGGFKHNTVRGTLWALGKEGLAESRDGKWFAKSKDRLKHGPLPEEYGSNEESSPSQTADELSFSN